MFSRTVINKMKELENKYQKDVIDSINHLCEVAFKGLRRTLPITKTKFNWDNVIII